MNVKDFKEDLIDELKSMASCIETNSTWIGYGFEKVADVVAALMETPTAWFNRVSAASKIDDIYDEIVNVFFDKSVYDSDDGEYCGRYFTMEDIAYAVDNIFIVCLMVIDNHCNAVSMSVKRFGADVFMLVCERRGKTFKKACFVDQLSEEIQDIITDL